MSISIEEKLKQINTMNIASISDTGTLQELASISEELINSSNAQERFLAHKIKNRLEQNDHYQNYLKAELIQKEEVKPTAEKQFERAYQAHRETASIANLQTKRQEEAKENKAQEAFNKLTTQQQQTIIKLEYLYLPELREQVREFILDDTKATNENFASIMNKQLKGDYVQVKTDEDGNKYITMDSNTPSEKAQETKHVSQQTGDAAVEAGKMKPAVVAYSTVDAANVQQVNNDIKESKEFVKKVFMDEGESEESIVVQQAGYGLYKEVFKDHANNLKELEGMSDEDKEMLLAGYEKSLAENITNFFNTHKIDLSKPENQKEFITAIMNEAQLDLFNNGSSMTPEQIKQILVTNCKLDPNIVNEVVNEKIEAVKAAEEVADEIDTPEPEPAQAPKKEYESPLILANHYNKGESGPIPNAPTFEKDVEPKIKETYEEEKEKELANTNTNQNKATAATATQVAIVVDNSNK